MKHGEIIQLGRHRLMCGDATNRDDVMKLIDEAKIDLVLTDPPYGVNIQHKSDGMIGGGSGGTGLRSGIKPRIRKNWEKMLGDNDTNTARKNYEIIKNLTKKKIIWGGNYFTDFLPVSGGWIFWDKERPNDLDFGAGELAYNTCNNTIKKYSHKWNGCIMAGKKHLNPCPRIHPTQKPVELFIKIFEDFSNPNDVVLDCFGGSGTTLLACELTNRTCFMMEISPEYCNVIIERYNELKNNSATA